MGALKRRVTFSVRNLGIKVKRKFFYGLLAGMIVFCLVPVTMVTISSYYHTRTRTQLYCTILC